jgi:alkylhydroperoxidase family enzyme
VKIQAVLENLEKAPIGEDLRAVLAFLRKLTREPATVGPDDINVLFERGVSRVQIEEALAVCFSFNVIDRLADAFEFHVGDQKSFDVAAKYLLKNGYK